jgi:hypothetical protein
VPEPRSSKPTLGMERGTELLPWRWAVEQLDACRNFWVVTTRRDGFPQARPVWGVWFEDLLYLSIGHGGVQRASKRADDRFDVTIHVDSAVDVVILEGTAERTDPSAERRRAVTVYNEKYAYGLEADWLNFVVHPRFVYGWRDEDVKTSTKWTFD